MGCIYLFHVRYFKFMSSILLYRPVITFAYVNSSFLSISGNLYGISVIYLTNERDLFDRWLQSLILLKSFFVIRVITFASFYFVVYFTLVFFIKNIVVILIHVKQIQLALCGL